MRSHCFARLRPHALPSVRRPLLPVSPRRGRCLPSGREGDRPCSAPPAREAQHGPTDRRPTPVIERGQEAVGKRSVTVLTRRVLHRRRLLATSRRVSHATTRHRYGSPIGVRLHTAQSTAYAPRRRLDAHKCRSCSQRTLIDDQRIDHKDLNSFQSNFASIVN